MVLGDLSVSDEDGVLGTAAADITLEEILETQPEDTAGTVFSISETADETDSAEEDGWLSFDEIKPFMDEDGVGMLGLKVLN